MWVSRSEWRKVNARLEYLERLHPAYDDPHSITVYEVAPQDLPLGYPLRCEKIALKDLVMRIAAHIGMGLKYRSGQPSGVDMVPLSPSAANGSPKE